MNMLHSLVAPKGAGGLFESSTCLDMCSAICDWCHKVSFQVVLSSKAEPKDPEEDEELRPVQVRRGRAYSASGDQLGRVSYPIHWCPPCVLTHALACLLYLWLLSRRLVLWRDVWACLRLTSGSNQPVLFLS